MNQPETISNKWKDLVYAANKLNVPVWLIVFAKEECKTNKRYRIEKFIREHGEKYKNALSVRGEVIPEGQSAKFISFKEGKVIDGQMVTDDRPYLHPVTGKPIKDQAEFNQIMNDHGYKWESKAGKLRELTIEVQENNYPWWRKGKSAIHKLLIREGDESVGTNVKFRINAAAEIQAVIIQDVYI